MGSPAHTHHCPSWARGARHAVLRAGSGGDSLLHLRCHDGGGQAQLQQQLLRREAGGSEPACTCPTGFGTSLQQPRQLPRGFSLWPGHVSATHVHVARVLPAATQKEHHAPELHGVRSFGLAAARAAGGRGSTVPARGACTHKKTSPPQAWAAAAGPRPSWWPRASRQAFVRQTPALRGSP